MWLGGVLLQNDFALSELIPDMGFRFVRAILMPGICTPDGVHVNIVHAHHPSV